MHWTSFLGCFECGKAGLKRFSTSARLHSKIFNFFQHTQWRRTTTTGPSAFSCTKILHRFHNPQTSIYIGLHNIIDIKFCGLPKKAKIFACPLAKNWKMYYSNRHKKKLVKIKVRFCAGFNTLRLKCGKMALFWAESIG